MQHESYHHSFVEAPASHTSVGKCHRGSTRSSPTPPNPSQIQPNQTLNRFENQRIPSNTVLNNNMETRSLFGGQSRNMIEHNQFEKTIMFGVVTPLITFIAFRVLLLFYFLFPC